MQRTASVDPASRRRIARALALVLLVAGVAATVYSYVSLVSPGTELIPDRPTVTDFLAFTATFFAFLGVGTLVAWHRPGHPIGWLFLASGLGIISSTFAAEYVGRSVFAGEELPAVPLLAWLGTWGWALSGGLAMTFVLLLFPTGRLPGPRWRPFAWLTAAGLAVVTLSSALLPGPIEGYGDAVPNPLGIHGPLGDVFVAVNDLSFLVLCALGAVAVGSLILRLRRAVGIERQQLKWILYPASLFVTAIGAAAMTQLDLLWTAALLGLAGVPIGAGIGILRHRLFDIDVVINRTLVYAGVTAVIGATYFAVVLAASQLLGGVANGDQLAVASATLAAAALFRPARSWVQRAVDRRFYRSRYDSTRIISGFGQRLRGEMDPLTLGAALRDVAIRAVQPVHSGVWLRARSPQDRNVLRTRDPYKGAR
ncbi:MAG TPA: hypothetical protein VLA76_12990 [Candidatus Angelobacter sp.]|nr:hypothetical protein [Candidatus Angelobacter sp.]